MLQSHVIPVILFSTGLLVACDKARVSGDVALVVTPAAQVAPVVLDGRWIMIQKGEQRFAGETQPTLNIKQSDISGRDACNQFTGAYSLVGDQFSSQLVNTEQICNREEQALSEVFQVLLIDSQVSVVNQDMVLSAAGERWVFRLQADSARASDAQGHGPDSGSAESISALIWVGEIEAAVKEAFWFAALNSNPVPLSTIKLTDNSTMYVTDEASLRALSEVLYAGVARKKSELTLEQWQALWANLPQQGTLQDWLSLINDVLSKK